MTKPKKPKGKGRPKIREYYRVTPSELSFVMTEELGEQVTAEEVNGLLRDLRFQRRSYIPCTGCTSCWSRTKKGHEFGQWVCRGRPCILGEQPIAWVQDLVLPLLLDLYRFRRKRKL